MTGPSTFAVVPGDDGYRVVDLRSNPPRLYRFTSIEIAGGETHTCGIRIAAGMLICNGDRTGRIEP